MRWTEDGQRFLVTSRRDFERKMESHMRAKTFYAFRRQLSLYGFKREGETYKQPYFSHPFFLRDRKSLLKHIIRKKQYKAKSRAETDIVLMELCQNQFQRVCVTEKDREQYEGSKEFFGLIRGLDKYKGIGLLNFLKELIRHLSRVFPEVEQELRPSMGEAKRVLGLTQFTTEEEAVNKKEILISLVNDILMEIHKDLSQRSVNPLYLEFNNGLHELNGTNTTFGSTSLDRNGRRQNPMFVEAQPAQVLPPFDRDLLCCQVPFEPQSDVCSEQRTHLLSDTRFA